MSPTTDKRSTVDWTVKGSWSPYGDIEVVGRSLFDGPFSWPVMVLRETAMQANIATMAAYCTHHGVELAPHGKTTMAPSVFAAQLVAGAWGVTVATPNQAVAARRFGVPRVLLANEVLDTRVLAWAADEVADGWEFVCYVDSLAGVEVLRAALGDAGTIGVLVELGYPGGRTGVRSIEEAVALAQAVTTVDGARLLGVAGFEGMLESPTAFLETMASAARRIAPLCPDQLVFSAGGSRFFDAVVAVAGGQGWRVLLRSGCYVSHDHGYYAAESPFVRDPLQGHFHAALEVWAQVLSAPEPGLVLLGAGKRDLPFDLGLPVVLEVRGSDGVRRPVSDVEVTALNDQHAYVHGLEAHPGELVRLGISHPCTAFDKWRTIPVVDDEYRVTDLLHTYF